MKLTHRRHRFAAIAIAIAAASAVIVLPVTPAGAESVTVTDPANDAAFQNVPGLSSGGGPGDLTAASVFYNKGTLDLSATVPSGKSPGWWYGTQSSISWLLDTNGDGAQDFTVNYRYDAGRYRPWVTLYRGATALCGVEGDYSYDTPRVYRASFPSSCFASILPPAIRFKADMFYEDESSCSNGCSRDATAWSRSVRSWTTGKSGYWMVGADGYVYRFGEVQHHGNYLWAVDIEPTPTGNGYWILSPYGYVSPHGDAQYFGSPSFSDPDVEWPVSISAHPSGKGYWVFSSRGRVYPFGDAAANHGDVAHLPLNGPVLDSVATPSGNGYYMVANDGGVFAFGDARFYGSMGGHRLNQPVMSLTPDPDGRGYWLVASDGGVFAFDGAFRGSMGGTRLNRPVAGMVSFGNGYLMVAEDGGIFNFSDKPFYGSLGSNPPASPIVAVAAVA